MLQPLTLETIANKIVIIGFFDVIHRGHEQLFRYAKLFGSNICILTFNSIPRKKEINSLEQRIKNLSKYGFNDIVIFDINKDNMLANEFVKKYLIHAKKIIVGSDFIFGSDMKPIKDIEDLTNLELVKYDKRYSTSKVKKLLNKGKVDKVNQILLNPFSISSVVVHGNKLGKKNGFPTANFNFENEQYLSHGVYLTRTKVNNNWYKSLTIYGKPNTIKITNIPLMETHILNFDNNIYGDKIKVEFYKKIANLKKFKSNDRLIKEIKKFVNIAIRTNY